MFELLNSSSVIAQDTVLKKTDDSQIQQQLENIAENTENEDADYTILTEVLVYSSENPINLNKTNIEEAFCTYYWCEYGLVGTDLLENIERDYEVHKDI